MSDHLNKVLIVGTSAIAQDHAKALMSLNVPAVAVGRNFERALAFSKKTGVLALGGGVEQFLRENKPPEVAIVCAAVSDLGEVTRACIRAGVRRLLVEKPGGLDLDDLLLTHTLSKQNNAEVFIGYNRRFYPHVRLCQEMIAEDGGAQSFHFDFTELGNRIETLDKPARVLAAWFEANSTHVVDLAFFLGGEPIELHSRAAAPLAWHPRGGIFVGHGVTNLGASFSYHANWHAPGRWSLDVRTKFRRFIFCPLETLRIQCHDSFEEVTAWGMENHVAECKVGFREQLEEFLFAKDCKGYQMTLEDQIQRMRNVYSGLVNARRSRS